MKSLRFRKVFRILLVLDVFHCLTMHTLRLLIINNTLIIGAHFVKIEAFLFNAIN